MEKTVLNIGKTVLPVGWEISKALKIGGFSPKEITEWEQEGAPGDVYAKTVYGVSAIHLLVGFAAGALLAIPLGLVKPKIKYRRKRAAAPARRVYRRRTSTRR